MMFVVCIEKSSKIIRYSMPDNNQKDVINDYFMHVRCFPSIGNDRRKNTILILSNGL